MSKFSFIFLLDVFLKRNVDNKAFENFEKNMKSANVKVNPKEGVVSERFKSKYMVWRVQCTTLLKNVLYCTMHIIMTNALYGMFYYNDTR